VQALTAEAIAHIDRLAQLLEAGLRAEAAARSVPLHTRRVGSMLGLYFYDPGQGPVASAARPDAAFTQELHLAMLLEGLFPLPRCAMTTTTVMTAPLIAEVVQRFGRALARVGSMVPVPA